MSNLTANASKRATMTAQVSSESNGPLLDVADLSVDIGTSPWIYGPDVESRSIPAPTHKAVARSQRKKLSGSSGKALIGGNAEQMAVVFGAIGNSTATQRPFLEGERQARDAPQQVETAPDHNDAVYAIYQLLAFTVSEATVRSRPPLCGGAGVPYMAT
jgi:hypothetical protein